MNVLRLGLLVCLLAVPVAARAGDSDKDGIPNREDKCPDQPETINGYQDDDGCPDQLATLHVKVLDLDGRPIKDALVEITDHDGHTGADGVAALTNLMPKQVYRITVHADGYLPQQVANVTLPEGDSQQVVTMDYQPASVQVRVTNTLDGSPLDAVVRADGPGNVAPVHTGADGDVVLMLRPGEWTVTAYTDHYLQSQQHFTIVPSTPVPAKVFLLSPAWMGWPDLALSFPPGATAIRPEQTKVLDDLAHTLVGFPKVDLVVTGHPDPATTDLAAARAAAVRDALVAGGVPTERLTVQVLDADDPPADPTSPTGQALGRSVHIVPGLTTRDPVAGDDTKDSGAAPGSPAVAALPPGPWIRFAPGKATLDDASSAAVAALATHLAAQETWTATLQGRDDASDFPEALARSQAVGAALDDRGIRRDRVVLRTAPAGDHAGQVTFAKLEEKRPKILDQRIYFDEGDNAPLPTSAPTLRDVAGLLGRWPGLHVRVLGHSDDSEPGGSDPALSLARAQAVVSALVKAGISTDRLDAVGLGSKFPASVPEGVHAPDLDRRATFVVLPIPVPIHTRLTFAAGAAAPDDAGQAALKALAQALQDHPEVRIRLHSRAAPDEAADPQALALQRASKVVSILDSLGFPAGRVEPLAVVGGTVPGDLTFEIASVDLQRSIAFEAGQSTLPPSAPQALAQVARTELALDGFRVQVVGHAGPQDGDDPQDLATDRAQAVAGALVQLGVRDAHLDVQGVVAADGADPTEARSATVKVIPAGTARAETP